MKFLSYFFALALVFSSVFTEDLVDKNSLTYKDEENSLQGVQGILNGLSEEESEILRKGLLAIGESLKKELEVSNDYLNALDLLRSKGLDISFFINIVPSKDQNDFLVEKAEDEEELILN